MWESRGGGSVGVVGGGYLGWEMRNKHTLLPQPLTLSPEYGFCDVIIDIRVGLAVAEAGGSRGRIRRYEHLLIFLFSSLASVFLFLSSSLASPSVNNFGGASQLRTRGKKGGWDGTGLKVEEIKAFSPLLSVLTI